MAATVTKSRPQYSPLVNINKSWISAYRARFATGDGAGLTWPLPEVTNTATITEPQTYYRTDWQGTQRLYPTARTNIAIQSQTFNTWANSASTQVDNAAVAPSGIAQACTYKEDSSTGLHYMARPGITWADSTVYCVSMWVKRGSGARDLLFYVYDKAAVQRGARFGMSSGTVDNIISAIEYGVIPGPNGWYRLWFTFNSATGGNTPSPTVMLWNGSTTSYAGDGTSGLELFGLQVEVGTRPTSYIATVAAPVSVTDYTPSGNSLVLAQTTNPAVNQRVATNGGAGDGVTTAFLVSPAGTPTVSAIYKNGVALATPSDYALAGNTATFVVAPAAGSTITWSGSYVGGLGVGAGLGITGGYGSGSIPIVIDGGDL